MTLLLGSEINLKRIAMEISGSLISSWTCNLVHVILSLSLLHLEPFVNAALHMYLNLMLFLANDGVENQLTYSIYSFLRYWRPLKVHARLSSKLQILKRDLRLPPGPTSMTDSAKAQSSDISFLIYMNHFISLFCPLYYPILKLLDPQLFYIKSKFTILPIRMLRYSLCYIQISCFFLICWKIWPRLSLQPTPKKYFIQSVRTFLPGWITRVGCIITKSFCQKNFVLPHSLWQHRIFLLILCFLT